MPEHLPHAARAVLDEPLRSYWLARLRQHTSDTYAGVALSKFPEDLRVYEHLLWASRADAVIEVVPEHPPARQARSRAWQQIAAIGPGSASLPGRGSRASRRAAGSGAPQRRGPWRLR